MIERAPTTLSVCTFKAKNTEFDQEGYRYSYYAFARYALFVGLKAVLLPKNAVVFCPETICDVVMSAFKACELQVKFFRQKDDLTPVWPDLESGIIKHRPDALLMVHYFGFRAPVGEFLSLCNKHQLLLIEDSAHAFGNFKPVGDVVIYSPRKVLPIQSGAILGLKQKFIKGPLTYFLPPTVYVPSFFTQVKSRIKSNFPKFLIKLMKKPLLNCDDYVSEAHLLNAFAIDATSMQVLLDTARVIETFNQKRQKFFFYWQKVLADSGLDPLYANLSPVDSPYCYTVYAPSKKNRDQWLVFGRQNGIDIFSWPTLPVEVRQNSEALSRWNRMLCFPIHQEIHLEDLPKQFSRF